LSKRKKEENKTMIRRPQKEKRRDREKRLREEIERRRQTLSFGKRGTSTEELLKATDDGFDA